MGSELDTLVIYIISAAILLPLPYVVFWLFTCFLQAKSSGWRRLSSLFPLHAKSSRSARQRAAERAPLETSSFSFQTGSVGPISYDRMLLIGFSELGLRLALIFPFHFLSPPMLIPWERVHFESTDASLKKENAFFRVLCPDGTRIAISLFGKPAAAFMAEHTARLSKSPSDGSMGFGSELREPTGNAGR